MIPLQLTLKNFLSYREATLDFRGLHVACICGSNGAGKSSLLEAIAWTVWGEGRAVTDDDVIHQGELEARVDFTFQCHGQVYRIIRMRYRAQNTTLEFQIQTESGFRSLTQRGVRATQQLIVQHLRLDYETFVNSAYLRQGRADEFMLKRPGERKQILADLLKLNQYETLAEQAKERSRQIKAEQDVLIRNLESITQQLEQEGAIGVQLANLEADLAANQQQQQQAGETLHQLQALHQQRQAWAQQLSLHQQQQTHLTQDCQRLRQELASAQQQKAALEAILHDAEAIAAGYTEFHSLQTEEEAQTAKFHAHQAALTQRQALQQQLDAETHVLKDRIAKLQVQLETLQQQEQELHHTLKKADDLQTALTNLQQARSHLTELDHLQTQTAPLLQRRQHLQSQIDLHCARLTARIDELHNTTQQLQTQQQRQPQLQQAVLDVSQFAEYLEKRRSYQQKVHEKGSERRSFMERLQEDQRKCETQLAEVDQKIALLQVQSKGQKAKSKKRQGTVNKKQEIRSRALEVAAMGGPHTPHSYSSQEEAENTALKGNNGKDTPHQSAISPAATGLNGGETTPVLEQWQGNGEIAPFPPCPICDRPLDDPHRQLVLDRYQQEREEVLRHLWAIREQLAVSEREIQVLRQEYRDLDRELSQYNAVLEKRGQLQAQLQGATANHTQLQQLLKEQAAIAHALETNAFLPEVHDELHALDQTLQRLSYDERNHALARGEVDRWRWAEIKQAELKTAQRRLTQLQEKQPQLIEEMNQLEHTLTALAQGALQQKIDQVDREIGAIAYDLQRHTALRNALRRAQVWQLRHQELTRAQQQYPPMKQRVADLKKHLQERAAALQSFTEQIEGLVQALEQTPDPTAQLQTLEHQIQERRRELDQQIAQIARLQQRQQQIETLSAQHVALSNQQTTLQRELRVYQELTQAFGKNGIQALLIENILPHLETETNRILGQLSNHQLHVQFITQRSRNSARAGKSPAIAPKFIETLDILIADARGTRPYETYSGGEAFRVNFAIRLALARLLAQRSGTALQLLIVDEGFGTQDEAGCDRLISAIQAIASDFACILTVTHMPRFKEAFQTRIEVTKTPQGSQLSFSF